MKHCIAFSLILIFVCSFLPAQEKYLPKPPAPSFTVVTDTVHYFLNKFYFKTGVNQLKDFPYYKSPAPTSTFITHVGSIFENFDTLTITGIESYIGHYSPGIFGFPVHYYLCALDPGSGLPLLPAIDSVIVSATGSPGSMVFKGGNFTVPRVVYGNFALLFRNMSFVTGDTALLLRTTSKTNTNTAAPASEKYSDALGVVRYKGDFLSATNFTPGGFGYGTDYEFMIAPRVRYNLRASHMTPPEITDTICTRSTLTFSNTSSKRYTSRFYNLNEFYRKWNLYSPFVVQPQAFGGFSADSSITWFFEYHDNIQPARDPRVFLPYQNSGTITSITDRPGCFPSNAFRACLRPMSAFGRGKQINHAEEFKICLEYCGDATSLTDSDYHRHLEYYPSPLYSGLFTIQHLTKTSTIMVYDSSGKPAIQKLFCEGMEVLDFREKISGIYAVVITDEYGRTHCFKLLVLH